MPASAYAVLAEFAPLGPGVSQRDRLLERLAGGDRPPAPSDGIELSDIGRLVVITPGLTTNDVPTLLQPLKPALWEAVPHNADLMTHVG